MATGRDRTDRLRWVKFTSISWTKDGASFFYMRFPEPGTVPAGDENYFARIYRHRLGEPQEKDVLVFDAPQDRQVIFQAEVTDDGRFLVLQSFKGSSDDGEVHLLDLTAAGRPARAVAVHGGIRRTRSSSRATRAAGSSSAPTRTRRWAGSSPSTTATGASNRSSVVPEGHGQAGRRAGAGRQAGARAHGQRQRPGHGARSRRDARARDRAPRRSAPSPRSRAEPEQDEMFFGFTSFTTPATPLPLRLPDGRPSRRSRRPPRPFTRSTRPSTRSPRRSSPPATARSVSMFLVHREGLPQDGQRPVAPVRLRRLQHQHHARVRSGRLPAGSSGAASSRSANLRGGGEYGEDWHQAGMLERKQNVFDDFIAAVEWLVDERLHLPREAGHPGRQQRRPAGGRRDDAASGPGRRRRSARCRCVDMLRYHLFTVGRFWIPEYGSADDPEPVPVPVPLLAVPQRQGRRAPIRRR